MHLVAEAAHRPLKGDSAKALELLIAAGADLEALDEDGTSGAKAIWIAKQPPTTCGLPR